MRTRSCTKMIPQRLCINSRTANGLLLIPLTKEAVRRHKAEAEGATSYYGESLPETLVQPVMVARSRPQKKVRIGQSELSRKHHEKMYDFLCDYVDIDGAEDHWWQHHEKEYRMPTDHQLADLDKLFSHVAYYSTWDKALERYWLGLEHYEEIALKADSSKIPERSEPAKAVDVEEEVPADE